MSKSKPRFKLPFDSKWLWGALATVIIIPSLTLGWKHIGRVWATPDEVEQVRQDQAVLRKQTIQQGEWIEQSIKETDMSKKAPKGFRWSAEIQDYVDWKDDPRLKKK